MMEKHPAASFDDWVGYCFTKGNADFYFRYGAPGSQEVQKRVEKFCDLDPIVLADYIGALFESPGFIAQRYSDEQIAEATWFLFGVASSYCGELFSKAVPKESQVRCMDLVATFYTDLFDLVCGKRGTDADTDYTNFSSVDNAVYMIWEASLIGGVVMFPEGGRTSRRAGIRRPEDRARRMSHELELVLDERPARLGPYSDGKSPTS